MNKKLRIQMISAMVITTIALSGCASSYGILNPNDMEEQGEIKVEVEGVKPSKNDSKDKEKGKYSVEQAMSDRAQLSTIAFSGLAFITGSAGGDTFMPPGKVADFFGFQYMRDIDVAGYGHNTQFLTRVANNVLYILNDEQKNKLVELAQEQAPLYQKFAYNRFPLIKAFRDNLEMNIPKDAEGINVKNVGQYTAALYNIDAELSYNRAVVVGDIINSFTEEQIAYLSTMEFGDFNTWPDIQEDETLKRTMGHTEFVAVMTYASELFSWYKGNLESDVYYCPERHDTYFGGFFMKDYPAMNNPDYFISTAVTGDKGQLFLEILSDEQRILIDNIIDEQREALTEITEIRELVSTELRKAHTGETIDKEKVFEWIRRYGQLDGEISALYAQRFADVNRTLTTKQREALIELRDLDVVPEGIYMFSTPIQKLEIPSIDYLFGLSERPENLGNYELPDEIKALDSRKNNQPRTPNDGSNQ